MGKLPLLYTIIVLHPGSDVPGFPSGLAPTLTRAECMEKMTAIRMFRPELRIVCRTNLGEDVIDSAGTLKPPGSWSE
jgi:hypothetical protein